MLKVTTNPNKYAIEVSYDGTNFCILPGDGIFFVTVERWYGFDWFGGGPYDSLFAACEAIFDDVQLSRFESGRFVFDDDGNIVDSIPLTYYDRPAVRPCFDDSYDAEDLMFCR